MWARVVNSRSEVTRILILCPASAGIEAVPATELDPGSKVLLRFIYTCVRKFAIPDPDRAPSHIHGIRKPMQVSDNGLRGSMKCEGISLRTIPFVKSSQDVDSPATLEELTRTPPMTAEQHRNVLHARVLRRRAIEDLEATKRMLASDPW
jgi:hypothetical protein